MHLKPFRKWVRQIYATRDEELDCDQLFAAIAQYVEAKITGEEADLRFPEVKHHLDQCAECYDMHLTLRDVALLESQQVASKLADLQRS
jgi:predicted anti-sigma-YlaC factor YlaD